MGLLKKLGIAAAIPVSLVALAGALLYFPPVQNWAAKKAAAYASEKTGMEISVDKVRLEFPLKLGMEGVKVIQPNDSLEGVKDTIADIGKVVADVDLLPLLKKQVNVNRLELNDAKFNTKDFIPAAKVKGDVGKLTVRSRGIDLKNNQVKVDDLQLEDARLDVALNDSVPEDTTESENHWKIAADNVQVKNSDVAVKMPGGKQQVKAHLGDAKVSGGKFDLENGVYKADSVTLDDSALKYDDAHAPPAGGLDTGHIDAKDIHLKADDVSYDGTQLDVKVKEGALKEKSGLEVKELSGSVSVDSAKVSVPDLHLKTSESSVDGSVTMDKNMFDDKNPGKMNATVHASLGKQDVMRVAPGLPAKTRKNWPNCPMRADGSVNGNLKQLNLKDMQVKLPTALDAKVSGSVSNLDDTDRLKTDLSVDAKTRNSDFVESFLPDDVSKQVKIPDNTSVKGHLKTDGSRVNADMDVAQGGGKAKVKVDMDTASEQYKADVDADRFPVQKFLPGQGLSPLTGKVKAEGKGFDFSSPKTRLQADADIKNFRYGDYDLSGMKVKARVKDGLAKVDATSDGSSLGGDLHLTARLDAPGMNAELTSCMSHVDLYKLKVTDEPFDISFCGHVRVRSDGKDFYLVDGHMTDIKACNRGEYFYPEDIDLDILTDKDTTHAIVDCGDFHLNADAREGYKTLLNAGHALAAELQEQIKKKTIDQTRLRAQLPDARVSLVSGRQNFVVRMLDRMGYGVKSVDCEMTSSPLLGLNGTLCLDSVTVDSILLDTVNLTVVSDEELTKYSGQIRNNEKNPYVFNALFDGQVEPDGTRLKARLYDAHGQLGVALGLEAKVDAEHLTIHSFGDDPILGYKTFHVNDDNYIILSKGNRVSADVVLKADDGTGVQIYTNDDNEEALQDLTVSLHRFDLEKVLSVLPYTPSVAGVLNGDYHVIQTDRQLTVSSDMSVKDLVYEHCPMGNLGTEFVYIPQSDGTHYVDGVIYQDETEVGTLKGTYRSKDDGYLDATFSMKRFPLQVINGFVPDQIVGLRGTGEGDLTVKGPLSRPVVNGEVYLDSSYLVSVPYGVEMRFANDPVRIQNSRLLFENFEMFANNDSPLDVQGYLDFSDLDRMRMNVRMRARNFLLIDAEENPRSEAYGKAYVNFFGQMQGPLDNLRMQGKLDVLGATDMTYVLRDSPLSNDNQLDGLVEFVNFRDTTRAMVRRPQPAGFNMDLSISVDENAHIFCALNQEHSNFIDLMGGGDLRMQYDNVDNLRLTGKYTLNNGEMKYALPIIPLKTFTIQDGSYIEFTGDAMNPTLHITATEQNKAVVTNDNEADRTVTFTCGVQLTKTLQDMGLQFIIDAPDDIAVQSELQSMGAEERGKIAVTMLTTGMYLASGNTSAFTLNSALSAFLNNQINTLSGNALRTLDLSFGMDNTTSASGALHTDYSFKFSKRFWNNRLRIVIGGKVSSGAEIENQNNTFFDNVSFEYRLSDTSNKYLKLFYEHDSYDWLEGMVGEFGGGFMWKRKLQHFRDIFRLKSDKRQDTPPEAPADSLRHEGLPAMPDEASPADTLRVNPSNPETHEDNP